MRSLPTQIIFAIWLVFLFWVAVYAHSGNSVPWVVKLRYWKDERTKACFALLDSLHVDYGPYFTYVPCELLDKADWQYYERQHERTTQR